MHASGIPEKLNSRQLQASLKIRTRSNLGATPEQPDVSKTRAWIHLIAHSAPESRLKVEVTSPRSCEVSIRTPVLCLPHLVVRTSAAKHNQTKVSFGVFIFGRSIHAKIAQGLRCMFSLGMWLGSEAFLTKQKKKSGFILQFCHFCANCILFSITKTLK